MHTTEPATRMCDLILIYKDGYLMPIYHINSYQRSGTACENVNTKRTRFTG